MFPDHSIEKQLEADGAGLKTAAIIKEFKLQAAYLKRTLDSGVPGNEASNYEAGINSFNTAASFLEEIWDEVQNDKNNECNHHQIGE